MLVMVTGLTTGYFGTLPMIIAPKQVESEHRELAGELHTSPTKSNFIVASQTTFVSDFDNL